MEKSEFEKFKKETLLGGEIIREKLSNDIRTIGIIMSFVYDLSIEEAEGFLTASLTHLLMENKIAIINNPKRREYE